MTPTFFLHYGTRTRMATMYLALILLPVANSFAVDKLRIIVENDLTKPGQADVYFPHLQQWLTSNPSGIIVLPAPHEQLDVITVVPKRTAIYGPEFRRIFPCRDGIVSLKAIPVTVAIIAKAEELKSANKQAEAATAFALTAMRVEATDQSDAAKYQRMAYESLAKEYGVSDAYVRDGNTLRASPRLVGAINAKSRKWELREDGRFTWEDFMRAADMKNLSAIVAAPQKKFFEKQATVLN